MAPHRRDDPGDLARGDYPQPPKCSDGGTDLHASTRRLMLAAAGALSESWLATGSNWTWADADLGDL